MKDRSSKLDQMKESQETEVKLTLRVIGNKEAGQEEHMANTNKDRAMCSNTTQTKTD